MSFSLAVFSSGGLSTLSARIRSPGDAPCRPGLRAARGVLLLERSAQLLRLPALLVEPGLKLLELRQLCLPRRRA